MIKGIELTEADVALVSKVKQIQVLKKELEELTKRQGGIATEQAILDKQVEGKMKEVQDLIKELGL
jgi:uncharacterized protein YPO0396